MNKMSAQLLKKKTCDYMLSNTEVRAEVYWWAKKMEMRLRAKDKSHKKGWLDGNLNYYVLQVFGCWHTLVKAIKYTKSQLLVMKQKTGIKDKDDITQDEIDLAIKKCYDGSNYFMMLADNLRNITLERGIPSGKSKK